jgi:hypothetical protein
MKQREVIDGRVGDSVYAFVLWKRSYRIKGVKKQM